MGGDISNRTEPRALVVWEGLLALQPGRPARVIGGWARRVRQWKALVDSYKPNQQVLKALEQYVRDTNLNVEIVTFLPEDAVEAINDWLQREHFLASAVATSPDSLARDLAYRPYVVKVFDPEPSRWLRYGGRGHYVNHSDPNFWS